jgi:hypothetical protein
MLALQVCYKNQQRKTRLPRSESSFELLEARVRQLFRLRGKPILMFYQEDEQHKIVLIDDEDINLMLAGLPKNQNVLVIQVKPRTDSLVELGNIHVIQRCCVKELRRKHSKRDILAKKKLKKDLLSIRKGLLAARLNPNLICQVLKNISFEIEMFFVEKILEGEEVMGKVRVSRKDFNNPLSISKSSIDRISKSGVSLFSGTDMNSAVFNDNFSPNKLEKFDSKTHYDEEEENAFEMNDVWVDQSDFAVSNPKGGCRICSKDIKSNIAFRCVHCNNFLICEKCVKESKNDQEHSFEPFFEAAISINRFDVFENLLGRIGTRLIDDARNAFKNFKIKTGG